MKIKSNRLVPSLLTVAALAGSNAALALDCNEIMNMVEVNVPTNIVVMTIKDSGDQFTADDIRCLADRGAPDSVINQAKAMAASSEPEPEAARPEAPEVDRRSSIDDDEDVLTQRAPERGSDLPEEGAEDSADPEKIKDAIKLYRAKKPLTASLILFEVLEDGRYPEHEAKVHYYLARCLEQLEMFHTAQYHYMLVIRKGVDNPYFNYALPRLVKIANYTGDDSDLMRVAAKVPPESYPRGSKNHMYYLQGVRNFDRDDLSKSRKYFGQVSTKSPLYLKSEYFRGVIYNQQGKLKSAVRSFRDVYREDVEIHNDPRQLKEIEELKDLSLMNVARIYYGIERFDESTKYYELVSHDSTFWPEALFENAWSHFMQNNLNETLGQLLTVNSPFYDDEWIPEAQLLRSLTFFNLCEYDQVERELLAFESRFRPVQSELGDFLGEYRSKEAKDLTDQAWNTYFGPQRKTETVLPASLFTRILRNQELAGLVRHMEMMDQELELIDQQKTRWRDGTGVYLKKVIEEDRAKYEKRAGRIFLRELNRQYSKVSDLLTQSEIVRFEVVDAQRVDYAYKARNVDVLDNTTQIDIDFATAVEFIYWPFNGEFWEDELGYYHYTESSACK